MSTNVYELPEVTENGVVSEIVNTVDVAVGILTLWLYVGDAIQAAEVALVPLHIYKVPVETIEVLPVFKVILPICPVVLAVNVTFGTDEKREVDKLWFLLESF